MNTEEKKDLAARRRSGRVFLLVVATLLGFGFGASADEVVVNLKPSTLQSAIMNGGRITFALSGTIFLTNTITIANDVVIDGEGQEIFISGSNKCRIFNVTNEATVQLDNLNLIEGKTNQGAAIFIHSNATLIANNVVFSDNNATNAAGVNGSNGNDSNSNGGNGATGGAGNGGAIYCKGGGVFTQCVFSNNVAGGGNGGRGGNGADASLFGGNGGNGGAGGAALGGAIYNLGTNMMVFDTTFAVNVCTAGDGGAGGSGGAAIGGGFPGDTGSGGTGGASSGGAIYNSGKLYLTNCTLNDNLVFGGNSATAKLFGSGSANDGAAGGAAAGGGVFNSGTVALENCTLFKNYCEGATGGNAPGGGRGGNGGNGSGGAVYSQTTLATLVNCTLATNDVIGGTNGVGGTGLKGSVGQGLGGNLYRASGTLLLKNSILAQGLGTNAVGTITDGGHNLSSDSSCHFSAGSTSFVGDPMLASELADNGGFTKTLALLGDSAAIDQIPPEEGPELDQRGVARPSPEGGNSDIGAFELERFTISGQVLDYFGRHGLTNRSYVVIGGQAVQADSAGFYSLVVAPGDYTIKPNQIPGLTAFTPAQRTVTITSSDLGNVNFSLNLTNVTFDPDSVRRIQTNSTLALEFTLKALSNQPYHILYSTDLLNSNTVWTSLFSGKATNGTARIIITNILSVPHVYYKTTSP